MAGPAGLRSLLQLTLDLFDAPAATPAPAPAVDRYAPDPAAPPAAPLASVLDPARFAHPNANRQTVIDGTVVAYTFERARRRSIGFSIGPEGLQVRAPTWVPLRDVDAALQSKGRWILAKLKESQVRKGRREAARIDWRDGAVFPFLGESVRVVLDARRDWAGDAAVLQPLEPAPDNGPALVLRVALPAHASEQQVRDAVQAWLMRQARRIFTERLDHFAPLLGVRWTKLALSAAGTRWGTAHSDGTIRLNWRLMHFRMPVVDYVVAHELSHLRVMDHSPRFWDTVATVVPEWKQLRQQLKDDAAPVWQ